MKIGDRVFVRGYIDEIRKDTVIIRNAGGYFGTIPSEVITGELPSAQPQRKTDEFCHDCKEYDSEKHCCPRWNRVIRETLSEQPEIIRCKDCKYRMPYDWMFSEIWRSQNINDYSEDEIGCQYCDMTMKADDFCSRAERRTDER